MNPWRPWGHSVTPAPAVTGSRPALHRARGGLLPAQALTGCTAEPGILGCGGRAVTSAASDDPCSAMGLALCGRGAGRPLGPAGVRPTLDQGTPDPLSDLSLTGLGPGSRSPLTEQCQPGSQGSPCSETPRASACGAPFLGKPDAAHQQGTAQTEQGLASGTAAKATCGPASHVQVLGSSPAPLSIPASY